MANNTYLTARQFVAAIQEQAQEVSFEPGKRRLYPSEGYVVVLEHKPFSRPGSTSWLVCLARPEHPHAVLASDREPHTGREFVTFDAAWRAIGEAFKRSGVEPADVRVSPWLPV